MFEKILIADRGAAAVRIARTCERLAVATAAVYGEAEREATHVEACDEAFPIAGSTANPDPETVAAIVQAAIHCGAQAVYPGYGPLGRDADFARSVAEAGLVYVGPSPESLASLGDRLGARSLATRAGVRSLAASSKPVTDTPEAYDLAEQLGYPVAVKGLTAVAGHEPIRCDEPEELGPALERARERALQGSGDGRLYLESYVELPRLLEVQLLCDSRGGCIALGEIETSLRRGTRRLLDESPAPALGSLVQSELKRGILWDSAIRVAREAKLHGLASAEFIMNRSGQLFFTRMRPQLQASHPITEMCTGTDLVELQLRVAAGEAIPEEVQRIQPTGHAIGARVYAEDPARDFAASEGSIETLRWPLMAPGALRVESGEKAPSEHRLEDEALLSVVASRGQTRHQALLGLDRVLAEAAIAPLATNLRFLRRMLADESYRAGQYDVELCARVLSTPDRTAPRREPTAPRTAEATGSPSRRPPPRAKR